MIVCLARRSSPTWTARATVLCGVPVVTRGIIDPENHVLVDVIVPRIQEPSSVIARERATERLTEQIVELPAVPFMDAPVPRFQEMSEGTRDHPACAGRYTNTGLAACFGTLAQITLGRKGRSMTRFHFGLQGFKLKRHFRLRCLVHGAS